MKIESLQNNKVKEWYKLKEKKYRDESNHFLIEGDHLVKEAYKKGLVLETIGMPEQQCDYEVTKEIMKKISSQVTPPTIMAVCQKKEEEEYQNRILILDDIQDPGNLGTVIRSAVAFSYDTIILSEKSVDLYNEKVIRSTEGMLFHINVLRRNLKNELSDLQKKGFTIYGTNVIQGKNISDTKFSEKIAIIIGNEGKGMNPELNKYIQENIYIPMTENCESLNAAISASIIMYESRYHK